MDVKLKYDVPVEVSKEKYDFLMREMAGIVAGQEKLGKYFIKLWHPSYKKAVEKVINTKK